MPWLRLHLLAVLLLIHNFGWAETPLQCRMTIVGQFSPWEAHQTEAPTIRIYYDGDATPQPCILDGMPAQDGSFTCSSISSQRPVPQTGRIEINRPGFKRFSRNVARLDFRAAAAGPLLKTPRYNASVDLGAIAFAPSQLPQVSQVILSKAADGSHRFEVILKNPLKQEVLLKEVKVQASRPGTDKDCCCPPSAVFAIANILTLTTSGSLSGSFKEALHSTAYNVEAKGEIELKPCNSLRSLSLTLPVAVSLPGDQFTEIQIVFPERMKIEGAAFKYGKASDVPDAKMVDDGAIDRFTRFTFVLKTSADDEAPIVASYPRQ
jgi:hypothetical protein